MSKRLEERTEQVQQECHQTVEGVIKCTKSSVNVQDATNVFFYRKIAEMQIEIEELRNRLNSESYLF